MYTKEKSQKAATTSTGTHSAADTTGSCEPVYSPPLDYLAVNLQCLVLLTVDDSYRSQQLVALAPCHTWAEAVCVGDGLSIIIQFQHMEQPRYDNDILSFISR